MTRILYIIPTLDRSGAEKQLALLATHLPGDRFERKVITLTRSGPYAEELQTAGIEVTCLKKHWKLDPFTCWKLRNEIRKYQPQIVHSWMFTANFYARLATPRPKKGTGPQIVVSERCVDLWKGGDRRWIDRRLISRTDRLLANSEAVATFYRDQGYTDEQVRVIPNGIELPEPDNGIDRREFLSELGFSEQTQLACYIGRLARQKRIEDLVWAFQMLRQIHPDCGMLIVGDGPERYKLEELSRHFGCDHLVRFLGHQPDSLRYVKHVDCVWLASGYEGMSNSLMEAMAAGKPVVASDIPANRELVEEGVTGYLASLGDSTAFAQFTREIFLHPDRAKAFGEAGREKMKSEHSLSQLIDRHVTLYDELLS